MTGLRQRVFGSLDLGWMDGAACTEVYPEMFFPATASAKAEAAKTICSGCEVVTECLNYALTRERRGEQMVGVWGGLTQAERKKHRQGNTPR